MGVELSLNTVNEIPNGTVIYREKEDVHTVALILKGRVLVQREGVRTVVGSGFFLGVSDLYSGQYRASYMAIDGVKIYPLNINHPEQIENIFSLNPEYASLMIISMSKYIREVKNIYSYLSGNMKTLYQVMKSTYDIYKRLGQQSGYAVEEIQEIAVCEEVLQSSVVDMKKAQYYTACADLPIDVQKKFYSNNVICSYHVEEQSQLVNSFLSECREVASQIKKMCSFVFNSYENDILSKIGRMIVNLKNSGQKAESSKLVMVVEQLIEVLKKIDETMPKKVALSIDLRKDALEKFERVILAGEVLQKTDAMEVQKNIDELYHSLYQILEYSNLPTEEINAYSELVSQFAQLSDKEAMDDNTRRLRKQLTKDFYKIYEAVFLRAYKEKNCPLAIDLFLRYGLLDETLLTDEQLMELVCLEEITFTEGACHVYDMKQWLTLIYEQNKMPSKSEFDLDYEEYIRSLKKTNEITEDEAKEMLVDPLKKLQYEINNMFSYNNRLVSGQISTFIPFLCEKSFIGRVQQTKLTADILNAAIKRIENIDYSVFVRELIYQDPEGRIAKDYYIKRVYPDIILLPVSGSSGSMWQEFSGRRRDSKGRFLLPIFQQGNLDDIIMKLIGRFRWEVCRTIQGANWNNLKEKSLTSEYMDYIQFYRKNRELSEDKKEKIKSQILKARNNTKEVFVSDYEIWIKNESQGSIRLNKVSREILATYCPFIKEIRENIQKQPIFAEAMARFGREKNTRLKEIDLRQRVLVKENIILPKELEETYGYYKNM